jgi:hypothetical protein
MNFNDFQTIFRDSEMKAWIAWGALEKIGCEIKEVYTRSIEELSLFHTVWYATPRGTNGDWRNSEDVPLRVGEVMRTFATWPVARRQRITAFRDEFQRRRGPVQLVLPAYGPNAQEVILLDGTHRAAAAWIAKVDVRLIVFAVRGPCDPQILPDLMHYSG